MTKKESEFQIELNELRAQSKQQITPPALFSPEQLEQIRAIVRKEVREEVRAALNENESERRMEMAYDSSTDASAMTGEELTERLNNWKSQVQFTHNELTPEQKRSIVEDVKRALSRDARISGGGRIA